MQRMKTGKAVGPDDIPAEVWKCLGEIALKLLTKLYNRTMESERMSEEWRDSVLILGPRRYTNVFDESKINRIR